MSFIKKIVSIFAGTLITTFTLGQTTKPKDYLGNNGVIIFDKTTYNLVWTSHPSDHYYKQEYLAFGDTIEKYKKLILLEVMTGKLKVSDVVAAKVADLKKIKASNPIVNFETFEKDGEIMLDFIMSENTPDGKFVSILERNIYLYKSIKDKNGQKGVLLFGLSNRYYGNEIDDFFSTFKAKRFDLINLVGAFIIPEISIQE